MKPTLDTHPDDPRPPARTRDFLVPIALVTWTAAVAWLVVLGLRILGTT